MVIFKKIAATGKYHDDNAIPDLINYICRPDKTPSHIIGGYGVDINDIANSMVAVSMHFGKYKKLRFVLLFSLLVSFQFLFYVDIGSVLLLHSSKIDFNLFLCIGYSLF